MGIKRDQSLADGAMVNIVINDIRSVRAELAARQTAEGQGEAAGDEAGADPAMQIDGRLQQWQEALSRLVILREFAAARPGYDMFSLAFQPEAKNRSLLALSARLLAALARVAVLVIIFGCGTLLLLSVVAVFRDELTMAMEALLAVARSIARGEVSAAVVQSVSQPKSVTGLALLIMAATYLVSWFQLGSVSRRTVPLVARGAGGVIIILSGVFLGMLAREWS